MSIGSAIKRARLAVGLTQAIIAKRARLSQQCISKVESGLTEPNMKTFVALCNAMGVRLYAVTPFVKGKRNGRKSQVRIPVGG